MEKLSHNSSDNVETDQAPRLPAEGFCFLVKIVSKIPGNVESGIIAEMMDE